MDALLGRERELGVVDAFVAEIPAGYRALVLEGTAGIGKTALLREVSARANGATVLWAQTAQTEAELAFAVAADLLGPLLTVDRADELSPPQRRALDVALRRSDSGDEPLDPLALDLAVLAVVRRAAASGPLLIAVDDLQWCDLDSARALEFALRRLDQEPIGLAVTIRATAENPYPVPGAHERIRRVVVGPLDEEAFVALLARQGGELKRPVLRRLHTACDGNPLFGLEVAAQLRARGPSAAHEPLTIPASPGDALEHRVRSLPAGVRDLLLLCAAATRPTVAVLESAHIGTGLDDDLNAATREDLLRVSGDAVSFSHPLVASAAYATATPNRRRDAHRRLADATIDSEERAWHLALAAPGADEDVARALDEAAASAAARGAPDAAARLLERAATLTPDGDTAALCRRTLGAARHHYAAGDRERPIELLEPIRSVASPGDDLAGILFELAKARENEVSTSSELAHEALDAGPSPGLAVLIHRFLLYVHYGLGETEAAGEHADESLALAEDDGDERTIAAAITTATAADSFRGRPRDMARLERAVEIERRVGGIEPLEVRPVLMLAHQLGLSGDHARSRDLYLEFLAEATERGDVVERTRILVFLSAVSRDAGNLRDGVRYASELVELGRQIGDLTSTSFGHLAAADALAQLGVDADARVEAERGLADADAARIEPFLALGEHTLGCLALAGGAAEEALTLLNRAEARWDDAGVVDPAHRRWPTSIEALLVLGRLDEAEERLAVFESRCREDFHHGALAVAWRWRGLLSSLRGDQDAAERAFARSLDSGTRAPSPYERAKTLLALGEARRRAKRRGDARSAFAEAEALFASVGADSWAERARVAIRSLGLRRSSGDVLTPMEERVAGLVARGATNRETAAALFLSEKTVEFHLRGVYRKLGVRSRTELANVLPR